jgi:hypothetical protein
MVNETKEDKNKYLNEFKRIQMNTFMNSKWIQQQQKTAEWNKENNIRDVNNKDKNSRKQKSIEILKLKNSVSHVRT